MSEPLKSSTMPHTHLHRRHPQNSGAGARRARTTHMQKRAANSRMLEGMGKSTMASPPCRNSANSVHDANVMSRTQPNLREVSWREERRRGQGLLQQRVGAALADHEPDKHWNCAAIADSNAWSGGAACMARGGIPEAAENGQHHKSTTAGSDEDAVHEHQTNLRKGER